MYSCKYCNKEGYIQHLENPILCPRLTQMSPVQMEAELKKAGEYNKLHEFELTIPPFDDPDHFPTRDPISSVCVVMSFMFLCIQKPGTGYKPREQSHLKRQASHSLSEEST
jgi:hypothetical protein